MSLYNRQSSANSRHCDLTCKVRRYCLLALHVRILLYTLNQILRNAIAAKTEG